jgi:hypothetical protein
VLLAANKERFRFMEALLWSLTWGVGVAIGVALGGWLTLVGGAGAPGTSGLDPVSDLVVLPGVALVAVTVLQLIVRVVAAALRGRAHRRGEQERNQ